MKQATLIVVNKDYIGDSAIDNVIGYAFDSYHADTDEMMTSGVRNDTYEHIVQDFYNAQSHLDMSNRRRLFHFVLSKTASKDMAMILDKGAEALLEYFEELGHQIVLVPHYSSDRNYLHYHWHVIVNSVSYKTGKMLYDRYETYNAIIEYLNLNPYTHWNWSYGNM